ncbi:MAG: DedA family protein [Acidobacteriota bacterium]
MELIKQLLDLVLHLDQHLVELVNQYQSWTYGILFLIIFCETGLVVTPFLPGDSLLFAVGALASKGQLNVSLVVVLLTLAAIIGDSVNYWIGRTIGPRIFASENSRWFNRRHLERTHAFYEKYGGKTLIFARFMPIVRTFAPFVAGIGRMTYPKFLAYSISGGILWISLLTYAGYFFGEIPIVKRNFSLVIVAVLVISVMPAVIEILRARRGSR